MNYTNVIYTADMSRVDGLIFVSVLCPSPRISLAQIAHGGATPGPRGMFRVSSVRTGKYDQEHEHIGKRIPSGKQPHNIT